MCSSQATCTNCLNKRTVYRILKEQREKGLVESPAKRGRRNYSGPVKEYTDNFQEGVVRRRIHKVLYRQGISHFDNSTCCSGRRSRVPLLKDKPVPNHFQNGFPIQDHGQEKVPIRAASYYSLTGPIPKRH